MTRPGFKPGSSSSAACCLPEAASNGEQLAQYKLDIIPLDQGQLLVPVNIKSLVHKMRQESRSS